jgi:hypothetical protein
MRIRFALALAAAVAAAATPAAFAADGAQVFPISAQNSSGETGTVSLIPKGDSTIVEVAVLGAPAAAQPAHVHPGSCSKLNPKPQYPLGNLVNGYSETTLNVPIATLTAGGFAVNIHKSTSDIGTYVACGDLGTASGSGGHM